MTRVSLWFWISAWMAAGALDKLDFAYSFEAGQAEPRADVLSGMVYLYAGLPTKFISDMGRVMAGVAMDVCPSSRAIGEAYQDIMTLGQRVYTLNIQFHVLTKEPYDCQKLFRLTVRAESIAKLLEQQIQRDEKLAAEVDVASLRQEGAFSAHLNLPSIGLRSVIYPKDMAPWPKATTKKTLTDKEMQGRNITGDPIIQEVGDDGEKADEASCTAVNSGCVCLSMRPKCIYGTTEGGFGICVESNSVPSGFTATTDDCKACHSPGCATKAPCPVFFTPCTCIQSKSDCTWNRSLSACVEKATKGEAEVSCQLCARQAGCKPPVADFFQPMQATFALDQFNASFSTDMRLTGRGRVRLLCEGDSNPTPVPFRGLSWYQGKKLMINARTVANDRQRRCELLIDEGAMLSSDNISFLGLPCTEKCGAEESYVFVLNDNQGPQLISTTPQSGTTGVKSTVLQLIFNEEIQYTEAFVARLLREDNGEIVAEFQKGPQVTLEHNKISIDIGSHGRGTAYSFEMPKESLQDVNGNSLQESLDNNALTFTLAHSGNAVDLKEIGLSPVELGLIIGGAVLVVIVIGAVFIYWSRHMQTVREAVGRRFSMRGSRISHIAMFNGGRSSAFNFRMSGAWRGSIFGGDDRPPPKKQAWAEPREVRKWDMSPKQLEIEVRKQRQEKKNEEKRIQRREEREEQEAMEARLKASEEKRIARKSLISQMGFDTVPGTIPEIT